MSTRLVAVLTALSFGVLAGCGSGTQTKGSQPAAVDPTSGNWVFVPANPLSGGTVSLPPFLSGSLMASGGQLTADFLVSPFSVSCSLSTSFDVSLTGTVQGSQLTLTSAPWNSGVFTVTGTVGSGGSSFSGEWSVKGGCADGASGEFAANYVPAVTGTWTGVLGTVPGQSSTVLTGSTVTLQLVQAAEPTQFSFPLTGTITVSGSSCGFSTGTLMQLPGGDPLAPSSITGYNWTAEAEMSDGKSIVAAVGVLDASNAGSWLMEMGVAGGSCDGATGLTTLIRQ